MTNPIKKIAIFDFDGTLVRGDSLPLYLFELFGYWKVGRAFCHAFLGAIFKGKQGAPDYRTAVKQKWLQSLLQNVSSNRAVDAAHRLSERLVWKKNIVEKLFWHKAQGHEILVATGALSSYIHILLRDLPVDHVLATDIEILDGHLTGKLKGPNSVRKAKAQRLEKFLADHGPYSESWGYGNAPHDLEMLELCTHKKIV